MAKSQRSETADEELLLLLASGATTEVASEKCGLSRRTIFRRLGDVEFKKKLLVYRADLVQRNSGQLTAAGSEGVRTLLELLKTEISPSVRLGAAKAVLEIEMKLRDQANIALQDIDEDDDLDWD